jgi:hypothetical protein
MSKGGGGPQTVTNQTVLPQWLQFGGQQNLDYAKDISNRPYEAYSGPTVAGLTADQQSAYDYVRNNYQTAGNTIAGATDAITGGNLTSTAQSLLNPYLGNVETGAEAQLQRSADQAQNDLASRAASAGAFGGTRFGVQSAELAGNTARQAGDLSANIRSQGWNTAVNTALQQAGAVSQGALTGQTAGLAGASALASAGAQQQNQNQADINALIGNWQAARDYPLEQLAIREGALSSTPYGSTTTSTQPLNRGNPAMAGLGGAATGAALGGALASTLGISSGLAAGGGAGIGALLALL